MYLPGLLNHYGFFPRLATLWKDPAYAELATDLLSRGSSAVVSINRLDELQKVCFKEFELFIDQIDDLEEMVVFNSPTMVAIQNEISPLLSSIRIMQDLANELVNRLSKAHLPSSMFDTLKKLGKYALPNEIKALLLDYWNNKGGKQIRDYRVVDQHHSNIADHVFLHLKNPKNVLVVFPDNPEEKTKKKFTYINKTCGISILRIGFDEIQEFIESVLEFYKYTPSKHSDSLTLDQWGDLRPFRKRTLGLLYQTRVTQKEPGKRELNISAIRFGQQEEGKIVVQQLFLTEDKLKELNG